MKEYELVRALPERLDFGLYCLSIYLILEKGFTLFDYSKLKKVNSLEAYRKFVKGFKIFFYFKAKEMEDNTYNYYSFNPKNTFHQNFKTIKNVFSSVDGYWSLYINNEKYINEEDLKKQKYKQLELF